MAETVIFEQTVEGFALNEAFGKYYSYITPAPCFLALGETYRIVWDGEEFTCVAQDVSSIVAGCTAVGDLSSFGFQGDGEPFVIVSAATDVNFFAADEEASHTISIYLVEEGTGDISGSTGVAIKNYSGIEVLYEGAEAVRLRTGSKADDGTVVLDGNTQIFSKGQAAENVEIELNLKDGDQIVTPADDTLIKSAVIKKPVDLAPENVRYGKSIGGVDGEFLGDTEEVTVDLAMATGDQVIFPSVEGKSMSKVIVTKPKTLLPENIKAGVNVGGIIGDLAVETEEVTVELDFSRGNHIVTPSNEEVAISKVTIIKPSTLVEENIANGVTIAGVTGSFQGGGNIENMPQLYAPTAISALATASDGRKYFTVTNPYTLNGAFPRKLQILQLASDGTNIMCAEVELSTASYTSTVNVYASHYNQALQFHQPKARFTADGFVNSDTFMDSSVIIQMASLLYSLENVALSNDYGQAFVGDVLKFSLTPSTNYYLPKTVAVTGSSWAGNEITPTFTYDPDGKLLTLTVAQGGIFTLSVIAVDMPWLRIPGITSYNYPTLKPTFPDNSEVLVLSLNGEEINTYEHIPPASATWDVSTISGASYGFILSSGYYVSQNKGVHNSYAICRLNFHVINGSVSIQLACINYAESSWDFGIISTVDNILSRSNTADSTNVLKTFKGSSSTSVQYVTFTVPEGDHFIEIKYRKDGSGHSGNDNFQFKVNTITAVSSSALSIDLSKYENMLDYGDNIFSLVAKADGWTDSDPVSVTRTIDLVITYNSNIVSVSGFIPSMVAAFELYIDGVLTDTVAYDGSGVWSVSLLDYAVSGDPILHSIYVVAIGEDIAINQSNIIESYLTWYTISYYDTDGTLLLSEQVEHGDIPSYEPTKTGYAFMGWDVELTAATEDASYQGRWIEYTTFNEASWETIAAISEAGRASKIFKLRDFKDVTLADGTAMTFEIVAFDHDDLSDGSGKAGVTFLNKYVVVHSNCYNMHGTANCRNIHWDATDMYARLNSGVIYANMPDDLKAVVKPVNKKTSRSGDRVMTIFTSADTFWLPSITELGLTGASNYTAAGQGTRYSVFGASANYYMLSPNVRRTTSDGTYTNYWTRSPGNGGTYTTFHMISQSLNGSYGCSNPLDAWSGSSLAIKPGILIGFCIK